MAYEAKSHLPQRSDEPSNGAEAQSVYTLVSDAARNNPVLVIGGAAAIGAIVVLALAKRETPPSGVRALERRLRRQVTSAEKALRQSVNASRVADGLTEIPAAVASRLSTWDMSRIEALKDRAAQIVEQIASRVSSAVR